ncbi:MAG: type III pantothenate kinase [Kiritimatiellia bacterium]
MKLIVVDVGNTSTAAGLWTDGRVSRVAHCDGGFDEASAYVARLLAATRVFALAYVSVVPKVDAKWRRFAKARHLDFRPVTPGLFPRTGSSAPLPPRPASGAFPLSLDYPDPSTIGADRLADAVGAVSRYGAPVLVMDFGTALTAAVITRDRVWRGGVIAPGFPLMRDYLFERTAKLPRMELGKGRPPKIGRSTEEAMRFGALIGYRGMVREIVTELRHNFREDFRLIATGGFARWALRDIGLPFTVDPTLTLYGAGRLVAERAQ